MLLFLRIDACSGIYVPVILGSGGAKLRHGNNIRRKQNLNTRSRSCGVTEDRSSLNTQKRHHCCWEALSIPCWSEKVAHKTTVFLTHAFSQDAYCPAQFNISVVLDWGRLSGASGPEVFKAQWTWRGISKRGDDALQNAYRKLSYSDSSLKAPGILIGLGMAKRVLYNIRAWIYYLPTSYPARSYSKYLMNTSRAPQAIYPHEKMA